MSRRPIQVMRRAVVAQARQQMTETYYEQKVLAICFELEELMTEQDYQAWLAQYEFEAMSAETVYGIFKQKLDDVHKNSVAQPTPEISFSGGLG